MGALAHLLTQTVTIKSVSSVDSYADPTFGAASEIDALVFNIDTLITGPDGNEHRAMHKFSTESEVTYTDRIWLPGDSTGDDTAARRALQIRHASNPSGSIEFWEVFL